MKFCTECGQDLRGSTKFCPECGYNLSKSIQNTDENTSNTKPVEPTEERTESLFQKTTRELGNNIEEAVEKIFKDRGYQPLLRQRMMGKSGQHNEIDVLAKSGNATIAIECKNYSEDRKVGIKEMRDFIVKLDDLDINQGVFITTSEFSSDAIGWANNSSSKQVDLWDGSKFREQYMSVVLGRTDSKIIKIENSLLPKGNFDDYSILLLKNRDKVRIKYAELIFHPFYIVSFNLREEFRTPDKQIHSQHNSGSYFVDGLSGEILYSIDDKGHTPFDLDREQKEVVKELEEFPF